MAGKAATPVPVDKPLSRAYLRQFTGWSTAFPPGTSDPTSLREMHNCSIAPDNSLRIRPGMRTAFTSPAPGRIIGEFEHFYTSTGAKAILFGVRIDNYVVFRCAVYNETLRLFVPDQTEAQMAQRFAGFTDLHTRLGASCTYIRYVQIDNKILALPNSGQPFRLFWVGSSQRAKALKAVGRPYFNTGDRLQPVMPESSWISTSPKVTIPGHQAKSTSTLISSDDTKNVYNFGYFYTFNNEIGESPASMTALVRTQRRWSAWNTDAGDESKSPDQLVMVIPQATWDAAIANGAVSWNLYWLTWSDQDSVPVEGMLLQTKAMVNSDGSPLARSLAGWIAHTPLLQGLDGSRPLPTSTNRDDFSKPIAAANGLVAGDRLVLVYDRDNEARITWTSNLQGDYLNFSSSKGGGFKTLTSGNLHMPISVKLWQNPSSTDTITILCAGLDGSGTSYYMNVNTTVSNQSQSELIIGFEETSSTPGTVSPFAVEVLNNALYHPLDNNLMKSTASNYNINHATMADNIQNIWQQIRLPDKRRMVSAQMDNKLYYLVRAPKKVETGPAPKDGVAWLDPGQHNGNQIWICDTALGNAWSCWDVQGSSLKKLELDGLLYMGVVSDDAIYVFDEEYDHDDYYDTDTSQWRQRGIAWSAVTNTQGANKAHDAWAFLHQVNVTFGNFTGECVYGIRGRDRHGKMIEVRKHYVSPQLLGHSPFDRYDQQDYLQVRRIMKEWEFFWESAETPKNRSYGSIGFVQYRYSPASVNVDYAYGSVETFEYQNNMPLYSNGVPEPYADTVKP